MAQTFHTRFTTDASQSVRAMRQFRGEVGGAIGNVRARLLALGALTLGGWGVKEVSKSVISLAADMQKTRVAFEVMLGGAEKAKKALGDLIKFADVTPFQTDEVIAAGRQLLAAGTATSDLTGRLELLGNIAAGTNMPLNDMVAIYAKMANKGKAQAEELTQLAERGIPIYKLLADMLKMSQTEVAKFAERGKLSFALVAEALEKLGGKGGQYFGLLEKQSKTLGGLWSTLQGNVKLLATEFGELMVPQLSEYLDNVIRKLDEMKKSGELDAAMKKLADTLMDVLRSLVDLGKWLSANRDLLLSTGKVLLYWAAWNKVNAGLTATSALIRQLGTNSGAVDAAAGAANAVASGAGKAAKSTSRLSRALGGIGPLLSHIALAAGVAFTGWQVGKQIAALLELEKVFTRLWLKAQGKSDKEINLLVSGEGQQKTTPNVSTVDLAGAARKKAATEKELKDLRSQLANLDKSNAPEAGKMSAAVKSKIKQLEDESAAIDRSVKDYEAKVKQAEAREAELKKERSALNRKSTEILRKQQAVSPGAAVTSYGAVSTAAIETRALEREASDIRAQKLKIQGELDRIAATRKAYIANRKRLAEQETRQTIDAARRQSAAEEAIAERKKRRAAQAADAQRKIDEERKRLRRDMQALQDERYHDAMNQKIKGWQEEIETYRKGIEKAEKALAKMGLSVDEDILKTPEQIAQDRRDELLRKKIEAHNRGGTVTFTAREKARIAELQKQQTGARRLQKQVTEKEGRIKKTEKEVDQYDRSRREQDWAERAKEMADKGKALDEAQTQVQRIRDGTAPLEKLLTAIQGLLKNGLPPETV